VKLPNFLAGIAVTAVAGIAAVVSFTHVQAIALTHGYTHMTAGLLPLSVDGLIVASSISLLAGIRPGLSRFGMALGITATVCANVSYGSGYGFEGAVISAWPAVAFIVASEILVGMIRHGKASPVEAQVTVAETVPVDVPEIESVSVPVPVLGTVPETVLESMPDTTPETVPQTVPTQRAPRRAPASKSKAPEHVFRAEIAEGRLPSLRAVKAAMNCGNDRARAILSELSDVIAGQKEGALADA
jgi:hypothetical protein